VASRQERYDGIVRLHLVYYGAVKSSGNRPQTENKRQIRIALSSQIEAFCIRHLPDVQMPAGGSRIKEIDGHRFIPLITRRLHMECDLTGVLLTPEPPSGRTVTRGDVDGRRKTVIDGLTVPTPNELLDIAPAKDPIFCLMEDDSLLRDDHIKPDRLLAPFEPVPEGVVVWQHRKDDSLLVIEVNIGVTRITPENMAFLTR
jgi:hypothetical protein